MQFALQIGYWGLASATGCASCNCDPMGSRNVSCHSNTGQCYCKPGVGDSRCDTCLSGYYGFSANGCQRECAKSFRELSFRYQSRPPIRGLPNSRAIIIIRPIDPDRLVKSRSRSRSKSAKWPRNASKSRSRRTRRIERNRDVSFRSVRSMRATRPRVRPRHRPLRVPQPDLRRALRPV